MGRLGAGVDSDFAVDDVGSETVNIVDRNTVIAPLPSLAAVHAGMHRTEESAGKNRAGGALEDDRADVLAAQRALGFAPLAALIALEQRQSILSSRPQLMRTFCRRIDIGSTMGKSDRHKSPP